MIPNSIPELRKNKELGVGRSSKRSIQSLSSDDTLVAEEHETKLGYTSNIIILKKDRNIFIDLDNRFDSKKDSGYGSQGVLKLDHFKVRM